MRSSSISVLDSQPSTSPIDNIRTIYGNVVANSLLPFEYEATDLKFKVNGLMTNANHNSKKMQFVLFINHRLVESKCKSSKWKIMIHII